MGALFAGNWIQKSAGELQVAEAGFAEDRLFGINAVTVGTNYTLVRGVNTNLAVGVQGSIYLNDRSLDAIYGRNPLAGQVYLRLYPHLMKMRMSGMGKMPH